MISYSTRPSSARRISPTSGATFGASLRTGMTRERSMRFADAVYHDSAGGTKAAGRAQTLAQLFPLRSDGVNDVRSAASRARTRATAAFRRRRLRHSLGRWPSCLATWVWVAALTCGGMMGTDRHAAQLAT